MYNKNEIILIISALIVGTIFAITAYNLTGREKIFMYLSAVWWLLTGFALLIFPSFFSRY